MASAAFQPHGLIRNPAEEALYRQAHIANVHTGIADPKEHDTSALMEVILYTNIFTTRENFMVNSQQPPGSQSDKRCDIVIRYLEQGTLRLRILCFVGCKRTRASQKFSLVALEKQAAGYCRLCLENEEDLEFVYVATMAGAHVRLWSFRRNPPGLIPCWGLNGSGDWGQYKDVGDDEDGQEIEHWFEYMKNMPPTAHSGQNSDIYGTASTIASSYQAPAANLQASASNDQTAAYNYPASASSYKTPSTTGHPTSSDQVNLHTSATFLPASQHGESVAAGQNTQRMHNRVGDIEENNGDY